MSTSIICSSCGSSVVESMGSVLHETGDGTPVRSRHFECEECGTYFNVNEIAGATPENSEDKLI